MPAELSFKETIRRFLQIRILECSIINKEDRLLKIKTKIEYNGVSTNPFRSENSDCNSRENSITDYVDLKETLKKEIDRDKREYSILVKCFETLNRHEKIVVEEHLLKRHSLKYISKNILYYSEPQLKRFKKDALHKIYNCLK